MRNLFSFGSFLVALAVFAFGPHADAATNPQFRYPPSGTLGIPGAENTAKDDRDPVDPPNQVISFDTDPGVGTSGPRVGAVTRFLGRTGERIALLDNRVSLRYFMVGRTCAAGAPRLQLAIDEDRDGSVDGNAHGYLGEQAFGGSCPQDHWVFEDMTNNVPKWDITAFRPGVNSITWQQMEAQLGPGAIVRRVSLVDDSASFAPTAEGCVYFDGFRVGPKVLNDWGDTWGARADGSASNDC